MNVHQHTLGREGSAPRPTFVACCYNQLLIIYKLDVFDSIASCSDGRMLNMSRRAHTVHHLDRNSVDAY